MRNMSMITESLKKNLEKTDFIFNKAIIKCIVNNPNIGTIPEKIGVPILLIGIVAKFAIINDITNSKG